jgi:hypothetical protein
VWLFKPKTNFKRLINDENYQLTMCKRNLNELQYSLAIHDMAMVQQAVKDIDSNLLRLKESIKELENHTIANKLT